MSADTKTPSGWMRWVVFGVVLGASFCRLLLRHDYSFLQPEVPVLFAATAVTTGMAAAIFRNRTAFAAAVIALLTVLSVDVLQSDFFPETRFLWLLAGLIFMLSAAYYVLKERFYTFLVIYVVAALGVAAIQNLSARVPTYQEGKPAANTELDHVLYLVLDEHIGIAGFPEGIQEVARAREDVESLLLQRGFKIYPEAFSNYPVTIQSLPSMLNHQLVSSETGEFDGLVQGSVVVRNRLFDHYLDRGYGIRVYQSDHLQYDAPTYPSVTARNYLAAGVAEMHRTDWRWHERLKNLLLTYLESNHFA